MDEFIEMTVEELANALRDRAISMGPIRHPKLQAVLLKEIRRLWHSIGKAAWDGTSTLEQWEICFMWNVHPENEVLAWQCIERATNRYLADHPTVGHEAAALKMMLCSIGSDDPEYRPYWDHAVGGIGKDGQRRHGST